MAIKEKGGKSTDVNSFFSAAICSQQTLSHPPVAGQGCYLKDMLAILLGKCNAGHLTNSCFSTICLHLTDVTGMLDTRAQLFGFRQDNV